MDKQIKFTALETCIRKMDISNEELEEFLMFRLSKEAVALTKNEKYLKTPLSLVYLKDGNYEVLPYLDLSRKDEVWGIKCGNFVCKKTKEGKCLFTELGEKDLAFLPKGFFLSGVFMLKEKFNATISILNVAGIQADEIDDSWHLTSDEVGPSLQLFDMSMGGHVFGLKSMLAGVFRKVVALS